jgi:hypothetical protein
MRPSLALFSTVILSFGFTTLARVAAAQEPADGRPHFGAGAEATTTGIVGGTFVYDPGPFHLDALLGAHFAHDDEEIDLAARFFFPVHRSRAADFSIGPGVGLVHFNHPNPPDNAVHVEGAIQIRAFLVSNVALSATAGIGVVFANGDNNDRAVIGGQVGGSFGITYFFF